MMNAQELQKQVAAQPYWYHRIELPGGVVTPGWAPLCAERYAIPDDLTGKRVLDIGAWDGYWTWEALKRGAREVVAIDDFSDTLGGRAERNGWETFDLCREAFGFTLLPSGFADGCDISIVKENDAGQRVWRYEESIYNLGTKNTIAAILTEVLGTVDVVFCFGVLYHLKHPLLALEKIAEVCKGAIYVESAVCDDYSPYRGGLNQGYPNCDMVMEFYPGAQLAVNEGNWWAPTVQCLGAMLEAVGFHDVAAWALTDVPKGHPECRGFASGTKDSKKEPAGRPDDVEVPAKPGEKAVTRRAAKVAAVMSVPRLGFHDNMTSVFESFSTLHIPLYKVQGAFWGQCLERGMMICVDSGADLLITVDYDTVFKREDVENLLRLANTYPNAAAIVPVQSKRQKGQPLMTIKGRSGQTLSMIDMRTFEADVTRIATGHFGLTVLRVSHLLDIPHPWFQGQPNADGMWLEGRIDDDIYFWKQLERHDKQVLLANRVAVGHLELMATWPNAKGKPIYQMPEEFHRNGKPEEAWR